MEDTAQPSALSFWASKDKSKDETPQIARPKKVWKKPQPKGRDEPESEQFSKPDPPLEAHKDQDKEQLECPLMEIKQDQQHQLDPPMKIQQQQQKEQDELPEKPHKSFEGQWILAPPIPRTVIPLPAPPSDCGSAIQSDSSLSFSIYTADQNGGHRTFDMSEYSAHTNIVDSDREEDEADSIHDNDEEEIKQFYSDVRDKTLTSVGSGNKSKGNTSVGTAELTDVENQAYPQSIFRQGSNNSSKDQPKKRVTLVEPTKSWKEEKEEHIRIQEQIRKSKRRQSCCRKAVYVLFFLSFLAIAVGGGLAAMVHFDVIDLEDINLGFLKGKGTTTTTITDLPELDESDNTGDEFFETPLDLAEPTLVPSKSALIPSPSPSENGPSPPPTVSVESTFIKDTLSGQFRIFLPNDLSAPPNRAVDWMTQELKAVGKGRFDYKYDNMGKFGQRFAILATQYSLLGDDPATEPPGSLLPPRFFFNDQFGIDECEWAGISCDNYGRVIGLDFSDLDLSGKIPSEIRYLFKLETLDLSHNYISGSIPDEIYTLRNLKKLYLYQNELTGTIATWIGQLDSLEYLHLSQNKLRGSIPEQLRSYSNSVLHPLSKSFIILWYFGKKVSWYVH